MRARSRPAPAAEHARRLGLDLDAAIDDDAGAPVDGGPPRDGGPFDGGDRRDAGPPRDAGSCVTVECTEDATASIPCSGGAPGTPVACERGCDRDTGVCRPEVPCFSETITRVIHAGETLRVDLCGQGDDDTHDGTCASSSSDGEDVLVRVPIAAAGDYRIEIRDVDPAVPVDPIAVLRMACDSSQVDCDDDGGPAGLDARLDVTLDAGEHFLLVDSFEWNDRGTNYVCGEVEIALAAR